MNKLIEAVENDKKYYNQLNKAFYTYINAIIKKAKLEKNYEELSVLIKSAMDKFFPNEDLYENLPKYLPFKNFILNFLKGILVKILVKLIQERG